MHMSVTHACANKSIKTNHMHLFSIFCVCRLGCSGGVKMRYPSKYVLITDLDDEQFSTKCAGPPVTENYNSDLGNQSTMHIPLAQASVLSERVWQNCITNPVVVSPAKDENIADGTTVNNKPVWDFADPTQKGTCICTK